MRGKRKAILLLLLLFLTGCAAGTAESTEAGTGDKKTVELYYFSPCESCKEEEKFVTAVRQVLKSVENPEKIEYRTYNVFRKQENAYWKKRMAELGLDVGTEDLPAAVFEGRFYQGSYEETGEQLAQTLKQKEAAETTEYTEEASFLLFTTFSCDSCEQVKEYLSSETDPFGGRILEYNILGNC